MFTWCGVLRDSQGVQGGRQAGTVGEHANPLSRQLLGRVPVQGTMIRMANWPDTTMCRKLQVEQKFILQPQGPNLKLHPHGEQMEARIFISWRVRGLVKVLSW